MNWTSIAPTKPGFYAWKRETESEIWPVKVRAFGPPNNLVARIDDELELVSEIGGLWCRLVPAEEVEKAWWEGYKDGWHKTPDGEAWNNSRAKRVMEGTEP